MTKVLSTAKYLKIKKNCHNLQKLQKTQEGSLPYTRHNK